MEGKTLWTPSREAVERANITKYTRWLEKRTGRSFADYPSLWRWSTENIEEFWESIWEYFEVWSSTPYTSVLSREEDARGEVVRGRAGSTMRSTSSGTGMMTTSR